MKRCTTHTCCLKPPRTLWPTVAARIYTLTMDIPNKTSEMKAWDEKVQQVFFVTETEQPETTRDETVRVLPRASPHPENSSG